MNQNVSIRKADLFNHDDRKDLLLLLESYKADPMGGGTPYTDEEEHRLIKGLSRHPKCEVFFCFVNGEFAGGTVCFETFATFSAKPCVNIHDFCILPGFREKGIGGKLLDAVINEAKKKGAGKVTLEVREDNLPAQGLYKKKGFAPADPEMLFWIHTLL